MACDCGYLAIGNSTERSLGKFPQWLVGWLGFNGTLSTQAAAISCLRKFKVSTMRKHNNLVSINMCIALTNS